MSLPSFPAIDLTNVLDDYLNKWVALSEDQTHVVGSGATLKEALDEAQRAGQQNPVVLFVPTVSGPHVLSR
jgi:hypothetical protein